MGIDGWGCQNITLDKNNGVKGDRGIQILLMTYTQKKINRPILFRKIIKKFTLYIYAVFGGGEGGFDKKKVSNT